MSRQPILGSDNPKPPIDHLWRLSRAPFDAAGARDLDALDWLSGYSKNDVAFVVAEAVWRHLLAISALTSEQFIAAEADANVAAALWARTRELVDGEKARLTAHSHAFHARLSSRHAAVFEGFERKRLLQLADGARLKTAMLLAVIAFRGGNKVTAAESAWKIANSWRDRVPIRLPGLAEIENTGAGWLAEIGSAEQAKILSKRAESLNGALAPYPGDALIHWPDSLKRDNLLRFGFAATILTAEILATK